MTGSGGAAARAVVLYFPRNGPEVEVDSDGRAS